ncbi:MAG: hypothetical protein ABIT61_07190 [Steroidobacteraceae bacterium]
MAQGEGDEALRDGPPHRDISVQIESPPERNDSLREVWERSRHSSTRQNSRMSAVLAIYDALLQAGIAEQPARRIVEAFERDMTTVLATKVDLFAVKEDVAALRQDVALMRHENGSMRGEISTMHGEITTMRREIESVRGEVGSARGEVGSVREEVGSLRGEVGSVRGEVAEVRQDLAELRGGFAAMGARFDSLETGMLLRLDNVESRVVVKLGALMVALFTISGTVAGTLFALYR